MGTAAHAVPYNRLHSLYCLFPLTKIALSYNPSLERMSARDRISV